MTFQELASIMEKWGYTINSQEYQGFREYAQGMMNRRRCMTIKKEGALEAIIFFFLTDDYVLLYKKSNWEIPQDNPKGFQIYIDKMICRRWTRELRSTIKQAIENKFPWIVEGVYHRAPYDRCVKIMTEYGKKEALLYSKV